MEADMTGSCLCGDCTYSTKAAPINSRVCHCQLCQKATGGPFFARILVPLDQLEYAGPVKWHNSSPELQRGFCENCGTALFSKRESRNVIGVSVGSLDQQGIFIPDEHVWISEKQAWVIVADGLPQHFCGAPTT